jgi:hypothetical protein
MKISIFAAEDKENFLLYRRVKYAVFADELGFEGIEDPMSPGLAREDTFDRCSAFAIARTTDGRDAAVLRGTPLSTAFPHREWFERHLDDARFAGAVDCLCSLNALAVLPAFRQGQWEVASPRCHGPIWMLTVLTMTRYFENKGCFGAIATTGEASTTRLFAQVGFRAIDRPMVSLSHHTPIRNIALIFDDQRHREAQRACGLIQSTPSKEPRAEHFREFINACEYACDGASAYETRA